MKAIVLFIRLDSSYLIINAKFRSEKHIEDLRYMWERISARSGLTDEMIEKKKSKLYF